MTDADAEVEGCELIEGFADTVASALGDAESDAEDVDVLDADTDCVVVEDTVPVLLAVEVPDSVPEPVPVRLEVAVSEPDPDTVDVLETVPVAVPEFVAETDTVSLAEGVPVRLAVVDPVLVLDLVTDGVDVAAAEEDVVADAVFVAECVSGPLVSVAVVV